MTGDANRGIRVSFDRLQAFITEGLSRAGLPEEDAGRVATLMAQADLQGSDGHGVIRLPQYVRRIQAGGINTRPKFALRSERAAMAVLDGDNGMGHLVMSHAVQIAVAKAREAGVGWVGACRSNHAGPASLYVQQVVEQGMIGLYFAVGNANHLPPWGGMEMLLSTNPIAIGIPAGSEPPVVLDMATTVAAYGKVKAKAKKGESMPVGWMMDRQGQPLTDPTRAEEGFLLPIGNHKGYGLALMVGLLAGTLNGAAMGREVIDFNHDDVTPTNTGQAVLALDPAAFGDTAFFKASVDRLVQDLRSSERLPGVERIWMPGEQSHLRREEYAREGIPIAAGLARELDSLAQQLGMASL